MANGERPAVAGEDFGTSAFTHRDDELAPVHTANPEHAEALMGGHLPSPSKPLNEVVFGPGAFGSPDPATLAHTLLTDGDEQMRSDTAPEVDQSALKGTPPGTVDPNAQGVSGNEPLTAESKAKDFTAAIEQANSTQELDAIEAIHDTREDGPFSSVEQALERKRNQLEGEEGAGAEDETGENQ